MGEQTVQVVAAMQILLLPNGQVKANVQGQATYVDVLGMLEVAKADILAKRLKADSQPKIITHADPALAAQMSGSAH